MVGCGKVGMAVGRAYELIARTKINARTRGTQAGALQGQEVMEGAAGLHMLPKNNACLQNQHATKFSMHKGQAGWKSLDKDGWHMWCPKVR